MPTNIEAELDKNAAIFQFLCTIPTIDLTSPLEEECFICKEKYQNNGWELGGTVHHPVALPCGHILGFQCLVRWALSANFHNSCSLCRAQILDPSTTRAQLSRALAPSFARLEMLAIISKSTISQNRKTQLLEVFEKSLWGEKARSVLTNNSDRTMAVWEEILGKMCKKPTAPVGQNRPGLLNERDAPIRNQELGLQKPINIQRVSFFGAAGLAFALTRLMWYLSTGRQTTSATLTLDCTVLLYTGVAALCGLSWDNRLVVCGVVVGVVLSVAAQQVEVLEIDNL